MVGLSSRPSADKEALFPISLGFFWVEPEVASFHSFKYHLPAKSMNLS